MASVGVVVQDLHDDEVADEAEDAGDEHVQRFIDCFHVYHAPGGLHEKLGGYDVYYCHVDEGSQGLRFFPAEGELLGGVGAGAEPDCAEGDEVGEDIGEKVEGVGEDGDGVGEVTTDEFDGHEEEGHACYFDEFPADLLMFRIHRN